MRPATLPVDCAPSCSGRAVPERRPQQPRRRGVRVVAQENPAGRTTSTRVRSASWSISAETSTPAPVAPRQRPALPLSGMPPRTLSLPGLSDIRPAGKKPLKINLDLALVSPPPSRARACARPPQPPRPQTLLLRLPLPPPP